MGKYWNLGFLGREYMARHFSTILSTPASQRRYLEEQSWPSVNTQDRTAIKLQEHNTHLLLLIVVRFLSLQDTL